MRIKIILLSLSLLTIPSFSYSAEEESSIFDEVVVTARKREESAQSVPIPISALDGDRLESRNITEIADVTKLTPNLNFSAQGINSTVTNVFLRGIGQSNWSETQDPKIGIYIDGVYLSRPQGGMFDLIDAIHAAGTVLVSPCTITVSGFSFSRMFDNFLMTSPICAAGLVREVFME